MSAPPAPAAGAAWTADAGRVQPLGVRRLAQSCRADRAEPRI